ncbi:DedA family protein [Thalassorhabdus alkalitolerans]|uniref:DedA family protein n=1 Tax=Thalassorhabdus alkalitolerans TaxID=2282697 RepID=A0ABW0YMC9_9BACI
MIEYALEILGQLGIIGLFLGVAIEALSIPFPAGIFILAYGYILDPGGWELVGLSFAVSICYVAVSYIPYLLSQRYDYILKRHVNKPSIKKMVRLVEKHGDWALAAGRMLGAGYIAYVAVFCQITPLRYGVLTFIGIFPTALVMFYVGQLGNIEAAYEWFQNFQFAIFSLLALLTALYLMYRLKRNKKYQSSTK